MKGSVAVACTPGVAPGFALAGLHTHVPNAERDTAALIRDLTNRGTGVLLIEDGLLQQLEPDVRRRVQSMPTPIVVPFPGPSTLGRVAPMDYVVDLLRRAIGYRVHLR
jgi:vacuolar-type H+-ATPase subunit F/Vma7